MHFSGTHEPFGTWDQVSMEWHPKKPHCEDHGEVVHWATSRWDSTQPVPPPQVVDPRYDLRVSYENGILNRMGPNDQGGFTIEWDGVQQGTDCHPSKPKNTQRLKYDEDYHSSNPTVWHKFAQPTHLAPKKKPVFWGQATIASFPAFEAKKWPHTVGKSPNLVPWPQLFRLRSLRSPALNDRAKRCRKRCTGCIRLLKSPTFHLPHKFSYISYINLGGAYDAPPILSNSGKWRVNGISYSKCNNPRGHCYILYATLQCHLTSRDSAPQKNGSSEKWTWDGATVWLVFFYSSIEHRRTSYCSFINFQEVLSVNWDWILSISPVPKFFFLK